jgi:MOSC domain-containing protein YiiM
LDAKYHGGPDQALYIYGSSDYDWWQEQLGQEILPGTFGENLTIRGLESAHFNVGDFLRVGEVTLQVTSPRIPCGTFAARMNDLQWVKKFRDAERPGLYCRVMQEGFVKVGDPVSVESYQGETLSILQMYRAHYQKEKDKAVYRLHLSAPIDIRTRREMEVELQKLLQPK